MDSRRWKLEIIQYLPELSQELLDQFAPYAVLLATFSFMYAALGRSKMFQSEKTPRIILSGVLSVYSAHLVQVNAWNHIVTVAAAVVASGLIGMLIYHVAMNRGKTAQHSETKQTTEAEGGESRSWKIK